MIDLPDKCAVVISEAGGDRVMTNGWFLQASSQALQNLVNICENSGPDNNDSRRCPTRN
ncbi:hypothetical protein [Azonexus sp.]|uniref:hypothetical protein n=1 Tax=Azonexus sp. TaxID=1872668 RepID=UPI0035AFE55B